MFEADLIDVVRSAEVFYNDFKGVVDRIIDLNSNILLPGRVRENIPFKSLEDLPKLYKLLNLIYLLEIKNPSLFKELERRNISSLIVQADNIFEYWSHYTLEENSYVDIFVDKEKKWYGAKILSLDVDASQRIESIYIHYIGWHDKFNTKVLLSDAKIAPCNTYSKSKGRTKNEIPTKSVPEDINPESCANNELDNSKIEKLIDDPVDLNGFNELSNTGRVLKRRNDYNIPYKTSPKKKRPPREKEDKNDWVCSICEFLEDPYESVLILCDGECLRSFHEGCLKRNDIDFTTTGQWFCQDCITKSHLCFACNKRGRDYEEVNRCSFSKCGKFYHLKCLQSSSSDDDNNNCIMLLPTAVTMVNKDVQEVWSFKCPRHYCDTCFPSYGNNGCGKPADLNPCIRCPRSFHTNCIPPGSRYNSLCLMCPRHPNDPLPSNDQPISRASIFGSSSSGKCPTFHAIFDQLFLPEVFPDPDNVQDDHFKLQLHIKEEVENAPFKWKNISRNDYDSLPKTIPVPQYKQEGGCDCVGMCGSGCFNRVLTIECCTIGNRSLCSVGPDCTNRPIQNKLYADTEVFREPNMGWGLRAKSFIGDGSLVIEYIGEIIDFSEAQNRMSNQRLHHPSDKDFYIMELDNNLYVDGKFKGNNSRFINHSCDPNCELQRWVVCGNIRIGIFAIKDIQAGESLSYDYQFDTNEADVFKCYCGADNCRGTMASKKKVRRLGNNDGKPMDRSERMTLINAGKNKEKKMTYQYRVEDEWTRSYTGKMLPGDTINEVKAGPPKASLIAGRDNRIFLVRNISWTRNMLRRKIKLFGR